MAESAGSDRCQLVDSHAHVDLCGDPNESVLEARRNGVRRILTVGFDLVTSRKAASLASQFDDVWASAGIHPHSAAAVDDDALDELTALAAQPRVVAVGETGLDFFRDLSPRDLQRQAFLAQIELARAQGLTLIVHSRDASAETLKILAEAAVGITVVLHCFALADDVEECAARGYYMSLAGNVTYKNAADLRAAAARIPPALLLTETDAPWLSPAPVREQPNSPANVRFVTEEIARIREEPLQQVCAQVLTNFGNAFPKSLT